MVVQDISIPVYFVPWSSYMDSIVDDLTVGSSSTGSKESSATDAIFNLASANGYLIGINLFMYN